MNVVQQKILNSLKHAFMIIVVRVFSYAHAYTYMWRSEDNLSIMSRIDLKSSGWAARTFTCWATSPSWIVWSNYKYVCARVYACVWVCVCVCVWNILILKPELCSWQHWWCQNVGTPWQWLPRWLDLGHLPPSLKPGTYLCIPLFHGLTNSWLPFHPFFHF